MKITANVKIKPVERILRKHGLTKNGDVQRFHTANIARHLVPYMPYRTGATIKLMRIDGTFIVLDVPYGKYLYYGKAMEGKAPKTVTDRDLNYTKTKNPKAGPFWDKHMLSEQKRVIAAETQRYVDRKRGTT